MAKQSGFPALQLPPGRPLVLHVARMATVARRAAALLVLMLQLLPAQATPLPPRSVGDIVALLRTTPPQSAAIAEARRILDEAPPAAGSGSEIAYAWTRRGRAAERLGLTDRYLEAYRAAWQATGASSDPAYAQVRVEYTAAEVHAGNIISAYDVQEKLAQRASFPGPRLAAHSFLAEYKARYGDHEGAERHLKAAEAEFGALGNSRNWGTWGYFWEAAVERARAALAYSRGDFAVAEQHFRRSADKRERDIERNRDRLERGIDTVAQPIAVGFFLVAQKGVADTLLLQGRLVEAEMVYREIVARGVREFGTGSPLLQMHLEGLAQVLLEQGRAADARELAATTLEILERQGTPAESRMLTATRLRLAAANVALGQWQEARQHYDAITAVLDRDAELKRRLGTGDRDWALTLMRTGQPGAALTMSGALLADDVRRFGDDDERTAEGRGFHAMALANAGRDTEALAEFARAIPTLLRARPDALDEGLTAAARRRVILLEAYLDLLARLHGSAAVKPGFDLAAEAFRVADVARASAVQRALAASSARAAIADPQLAQLARDEQDLSQRIATLADTLSRLASAAPGQRLDGIIATMRKDLPRLKTERRDLRERIARDFPAYADLVDPRPLAPEDVRGLLVDGEAMLAVYGGERRTFVWAIPKRGDIRFAVSDMPAGELAAKVARVREGMEPGSGSGEDLRFDLDAAHDIYRRIVAPLAPALAGQRALLVVAHGALGQLPLALLPTKPAKLAKGTLPLAGYADVPWLIRDFAITQLPSASTLAALRARPLPTAERQPFLGFGDPQFAAQATAPASAGGMRGVVLRRRVDTRGNASASLADLAPLPDTAAELRAMAAALRAGDAAVRLGSAASESAVRRADLAGYRVLAFATHGLTPGDLDGLSQPALALANPAQTGETDADGLLTMEEILGLRMNADWVVLSACNTAAGDGQSAEAVSGLGRAFFYAGTRALLATHWPVETVSARLLTSELFRLQAEQPALTRAEALRAAMLAVMAMKASDAASGKALYSYAHPLFWAPFALIGDGGR